MRIIIGILALIAAYFIIFPYKTERVCFGNSCANSGVYVLYRLPMPQTICKASHKFPIILNGVYVGCSPYPGAVK